MKNEKFCSHPYNLFLNFCLLITVFHSNVDMRSIVRFMSSYNVFLLVFHPTCRWIKFFFWNIFLFIFIHTWNIIPFRHNFNDAYFTMKCAILNEFLVYFLHFLPSSVPFHKKGPKKIVISKFYMVCLHDSFFLQIFFPVVFIFLFTFLYLQYSNKYFSFWFVPKLGLI